MEVSTLQWDCSSAYVPCYTKDTHQFRNITQIKIPRLCLLLAPNFAHAILELMCTAPNRSRGYDSFFNQPPFKQQRNNTLLPRRVWMFYGSVLGCRWLRQSRHHFRPLVGYRLALHNHPIHEHFVMLLQSLYALQLTANTELRYFKAMSLYGT